MELGDKSKKYAVQVYMVATASKCAGVIYCDSEEEYNSIVDNNIDDIWEKGDFDINCHNNFDLGDPDIEAVDFSQADKFLLNNERKQ